MKGTKGDERESGARGAGRRERSRGGAERVNEERAEEVGQVADSGMGKQPI